MAVFIAIMMVLFIAVYAAIMVYQLITLVAVIQNSIRNPTYSGGLFLPMPFLVILYMIDVFTMMIWYWGAPAFTMTQGQGYCMSLLFK